MISGIEFVIGWILQNFHKEIFGFSAGQLKKVWSESQVSKAAEKYIVALKEIYDVVQIWKMSEPIALKKIFTHVNVLKPSTFKKAPNDAQAQMIFIEGEIGAYYVGKPQNALDTVRENKRLFILGKPGAGKTTFLKYLMLQAAEGEQKCLPIFISLKEFSNFQKSLFDFIIQQFEVCELPDNETKSFVKTLLRRGESFKLDKDSIETLGDKDIPADYTDKLEPFIDKEYTTKQQFEDELEEVIGINKYLPSIAEHARKISFRLSDNSLVIQQKNKTPKKITKKLQYLKYKKYSDEKNFLEEVERLIKNDWQRIIFFSDSSEETFEITNIALQNLNKNQDIPKSFSEKLQNLRNRKYQDRKSFLTVLDQTIDIDEWYDEMMSEIVNAAQIRQGFSFTDEFLNQLTEGTQSISKSIIDKFRSSEYPTQEQFQQEVIKNLKLFRITSQIIEDLKSKEEKIPYEILEALESLKDQKFFSEHSFFDSLKRQIETQQIDKYKELVLRYAEELKPFTKHEKYFQFDRQVLEDWKLKSIPDEVWKALESIESQKFSSQDELLNAIERQIKGQETGSNSSKEAGLVLKYAKKIKPRSKEIAIFKFTRSSLKKLKTRKIPNAMWKSLNPLTDKEFLSLNDFLNATKQEIGKEESTIKKAIGKILKINKYKKLISEHIYAGEQLLNPENFQKNEYFMLARRSFKKLTNGDIPEYFLKKLKAIEKQEYKSIEDFSEAIVKVLYNKTDMKSFLVDILLQQFQKKQNIVIDKQFLQRLEEENIPLNIIDKIKRLPNKSYREQESFLRDLKETIEQEWYDEIISNIIMSCREENFVLTERMISKLKKEKNIAFVPEELKALREKEYASQKDFFDAIIKASGIEQYKELILTYARSPKVMIMCDGLDEVNKEGGSRNEVIQEINTFCRQYTRCQVIITCRIAASEYFFENFVYVELADFDRKQVGDFVSMWFKDDPMLANRFLNEYEYMDHGHTRLRDLTRIPLLLTLLCISFQNLQSFPRRRVEIYTEALDAMLKEWDLRRKIKRDKIHDKLTLGTKPQMLAHIAYEAFEQGEFIFKTEELSKKIKEYLQKLPPLVPDDKINGEKIIERMIAQHGIWIERSKGFYSFSHLTFQEYFTAKYIVDNTHNGTLEKLIRPSFKLTKQSLESLRKKSIPDKILEGLQLLENQKFTNEKEFLNAVEKRIGNEQTVSYKELILEHTLIEHFDNDQWREVFLLTAEMLDNADVFFETLIKQATSQKAY